MPPSRITILGVGLLGGSLGLAAKRLLNNSRIVGYSHRSSTLNDALRLGAIDEAYESPQEAVRSADRIVLCTPVGVFDPLLREISPALRPGTIVTDVGSTKRTIVACAERLLPAGVHFVGSHPMAGSEKRGVEFARADLFDNALCIVTPSERTNADALARVEQFWKSIRMRVTRISPEEHDQRLAEVSHLPHAVAAALMQCVGAEGFNLTGKGFVDLTRIAGGDGGLWRDILLDNRENVRAGIEKLKASLDQLSALLEPKQSEALKTWLDSAARKRAELERRWRGDA